MYAWTRTADSRHARETIERRIQVRSLRDRRCRDDGDRVRYCMHAHVAIGSEEFPEARLPLAAMIVPCHPDRVVTVRCPRRHIAWSSLRGVQNLLATQDCADLEILRTCRCDMPIDNHRARGSSLLPYHNGLPLATDNHYNFGCWGCVAW